MHFECALCGSTQADVTVVKDAKSRAPLEIASCLDCGLVQHRTLPSDASLKIYYSHNYRQDYKNTYSPKLKYVRRAGIAANQRIATLKALVELNGKHLLDIGAGGGEFVYLASHNGLVATGIEPNEGYSEFAKKEYGVDIKTMMLDDVTSASADVVSLFHVLEHMAKPKDVMAKLYEVLNDGGYLFVEVPNILQNDASPHNIYFKAHLFYYSRFTLISMASKYFDPVAIFDQGNLLVLFKKKSSPLSHDVLPTQDDITHSQQRMRQKGWGEYLLVGGGLTKPFKRFKQHLIERRIDPAISPRTLLDNL